MGTQYISSVGTFNVPENHSALDQNFPMGYQEIFEGIDSLGDECYREVPRGFREGLKYEAIDSNDWITVYLAVIDNQTGHLVADCLAGGWADEAFVILEHGHPVKAADNSQPKPYPTTP